VPGGHRPELAKCAPEDRAMAESGSLRPSSVGSGLGLSVDRPAGAGRAARCRP
jgi:hypothetical protein